MKHLLTLTTLSACLALPALGCGGTSAQDQQRALSYQQKSDEAGKNGQYGVAGQDQRKAQDAHYSAVTKAIDEGKPIPPQPQMGDTPAPPPAPQKP